MPRERDFDADGSAVEKNPDQLQIAEYADLEVYASICRFLSVLALAAGAAGVALGVAMMFVRFWTGTYIILGAIIGGAVAYARLRATAAGIRALIHVSENSRLTTALLARLVYEKKLEPGGEDQIE